MPSNGLFIQSPAATLPQLKPTLYRSIIFWSGLLVLLFIVWAWVDSEMVLTPTSVWCGKIGFAHFWGRLLMMYDGQVYASLPYRQMLFPVLLLWLGLLLLRSRRMKRPLPQT